ncbi:MAG: hypothetical protein O7B35_01695, partial [Deltaproteobacteria bacterium]|nr:hypothetical protein [Deltaproteobacteria bacterium]
MHRPHVSDLQRRERLSFTGCSHELDLQTIGFIHLHNSAKVSAAETLLWEVRVKHYGIKNLV